MRTTSTLETSPRESDELAAWLIGPGRLSGDAATVTSGLAQRLTGMGVPLHRLRLAMRVDNPLLTAWGILWGPEMAARIFSISRALLDTPTYIGSPAQQVIERGNWFRQRLDQLGPEDHMVLQDLANEGFTDYIAVPVAFGNGISQGAMFATRNPNGFADSHLTIIKNLSVPLSAALEPIAMRRSTESLLATFLGEGPAARVQDGAIRRGDIVETEAAILLTDMRGFTPLSLTSSPAQLLTTLGRYFEVVVDAVRAEGGDVLKFVGDGVLSIFEVSDSGRAAACGAAVRAASHAVARARAEGLPPFVGALHVGPVMYGNVGSLTRLDFTVVGLAVNIASRLEEIAKASGQTLVCSGSFASDLPAESVRNIGQFKLKGLTGEHDVFTIAADDGSQA